eukprot:2475708-Prymnesium_polylepis.1
MASSSRLKVAVTRSLRAVRILRTTIERRTSLERSLNLEAARLPAPERSVLREITSGSLRHLAKYDHVLARLAPSIADADLPLRLLATATLHEVEQMDSKPRSLARRIEEACGALERRWAAAALIE